MEKKSIHTGHRARIKEEFLSRGAEGWPDHKLLELLLFYAIPQGDTNPLAHELMERFGSLSGVLDALPKDLMNVKGMGEHSAVLLHLIPAVLGRYLEGHTAPGKTVHTTQEAKAILARYFRGLRNELVYILCLDAKYKNIGVKLISQGNLNNSDVTIRRVAEECLALRATYCYLAHNHVSNIALPSPDDINTTDIVRAALAPLQIQLVDHLVFSDDDMVSIKESRTSGWSTGFRMVSPSRW